MGESFAERVERTAAQFAAWCRAHGHHVTPDGGVYEPTAALLLDRAPDTLAHWRADDAAHVPFYRSGRNGRVRYRIADLATFIEQQRQDGGP